MFRVRDNNKHVIGTNIMVHLVQHLDDGEPKLKTITLEPYGILIWPLEIVHKITEESPFWNLSAKNLLAKRYVICVGCN